MKIVSLQLPPTPSACRRSVTLVPNIGQHADERIATLSIVQQSSVVPGAKCRADSYALHERPEHSAAGCRAFTLTKLDGGMKGELYWTVIADDETRDTCTCDAGKFRGGCKHRGSLRALIADGSLEESDELAVG